ncbi:putative Exo-beta-1,3-glucanase [Camillea tinctor]|nr:putative Exo-beta-1,3-glucanase [Camillea tinctor]
MMGRTCINMATIVAIILFAGMCGATPHGTLSAIARDSNFVFGVDKVRGVNLGGWLVLEPWITPSVFSSTPENVVDEFTLTQTLGADAAAHLLDRHWSTWITQADIKDIASKGLNFVRIPVGYWSVTPLDEDPYVQGAYEYLRMALDWAKSSNIKVIIDLHGAPGSQNGLDNSGRRGTIQWTQGSTVAQTLNALKKLRDDFASHPAVASIELLNEPMSPNLDMGVVKQFMSEGVSNLANSDVVVAFHDAFLGPAAWNDWNSGSSSPLLLDTHHYEVFDSGQLQMDAVAHISSACSFGTQMTSSNRWTISGEFSGAMTDCAKWLNGRGVGARYDGTYNRDSQGTSYIGSCDGKVSSTIETLSQSDRDNIRNFINAQIVAYEKAAGWIFWAWKTESALEWSFRDLFNAGIIPQSFIANPSICG